MNEKMSFKLGVTFAASVDMGKDFLDVWHVSLCKNSGSELQSI